MVKARKLDNVVLLAKKLMQKGAYVISNHAKLRQGERNFTIEDIRNILGTGHHEKRKDEYKELKVNYKELKDKYKKLEDEHKNLKNQMSNDISFIEKK